jgi:hypothetical protein
MNLTKHAQKRMQQRAIPYSVVEALLDCGQTNRRGGVEKVYFNKKSRRKALCDSELNDLVRERSNLLNAYLVKQDTTVITVGYRQKRFRD